jgi:uncharacterized protein YkwD
MTRTVTTVLLCWGLGLLAAPAGEKAKPFAHSADETKIFELTNLERKKEQVAALKLNPALSKIARAHSENMARQGKMEHNLDDKGPNDRARAGGYKYESLGENIATGSADAALEEIMKRWMGSKGHRANILDADYTEIGVGIATDKDGRRYLTQVFATPDDD